MKFEYGDQVKIIAPGFFNGRIGTAVNIRTINEPYEHGDRNLYLIKVQLRSFGETIELPETALELYKY